MARYQVQHRNSIYFLTMPRFDVLIHTDRIHDVPCTATCHAHVSCSLPVCHTLAVKKRHLDPSSGTTSTGRPTPISSRVNSPAVSSGLDRLAVLATTTLSEASRSMRMLEEQ